MGHAKLHSDSLDGVIEDLLHAGNAEALVGKILGVVIVVELTGSTLIVKVIEAVVVLVAPAIVLVALVLVPAIIRQGGGAFSWEVIMRERNKI